MTQKLQLELAAYKERARIMEDGGAGNSTKVKELEREKYETESKF